MDSNSILQYNTRQYACGDWIENHLTNNFLFLSLCQDSMFADTSAFKQDLRDWDLSSAPSSGFTKVAMFAGSDMPCVGGDDDDAFYPLLCTGNCRNNCR